MRQRTFVSKEPIQKGWSIDKKYCVTTADGNKYLLRITPEEKSANRAEMFRLMQEVEALGVPMCKPVEFGKWGEGVYILLTWINGNDAEDIIPNLSESKQYEYGLEAGKMLQAIHSIPAPENQPDWDTRFNAKMNLKIKQYN